MKKISVLTVFVLILSFLFAQQSSLEKKYLEMEKRFEEELSKVKTRAEYDKFLEKKRAEIREFLKEFSQNLKSSEKLLKADLLIQVEDYSEAETILNKLRSEKEFSQKANLLLAKLNIARKNWTKAGEALKGIQEKNEQYWELLLEIAFEHPDNKQRAFFNRELIGAAQLPPQIEQNRVFGYLNLAEIETLAKNFEQANKIISEGLEKLKDENSQRRLKNALNQIKIFGKTAPEVNITTWLNGGALKLADLKGKVVLIDFWAPWCPPCRETIPALVNLHRKYQQELVIIGITKYYGYYRDDQISLGKISAREELENIEKFVKRFKIEYPVAVSEDGREFQEYGVSGIPTLYFINKKGEIVNLKVGAETEEEIEKKIRDLLK